MVNQSEHRMYRYHHKALNEKSPLMKMTMIIVEVFFIHSSIVETLSAQTRTVHKAKGYAIRYDIHTQAKAPPIPPLRQPAAVRAPQSSSMQCIYAVSNKALAAAKSRRRKWIMDKRNSSPEYLSANGSLHAFPYPELMYTAVSLQPHARLIRS